MSTTYLSLSYNIALSQARDLDAETIRHLQPRQDSFLLSSDSEFATIALVGGDVNDKANSMSDCQVDSSQKRL